VTGEVSWTQKTIGILEALSEQLLAGYLRIDVSLSLREAITFQTSGKMFWPFVKVWQGYKL
jgi:hypothetical protein